MVKCLKIKFRISNFQNVCPWLRLSFSICESCSPRPSGASPASRGLRPMLFFVWVLGLSLVKEVCRLFLWQTPTGKNPGGSGQASGEATRKINFHVKLVTNLADFSKRHFFFKLRLWKNYLVYLFEIFSINLNFCNLSFETKTN